MNDSSSIERDLTNGPNQRMSDKRRRRNSRPLPADFDALAGESELWSSLDLDTLKRLAVHELVKFGFSADEEGAGTLKDLYPVLLDRTEEIDRREIEVEVVRRIEAGAASVESLVPLILADSSLMVVSSTALDFAVLGPLEGNDPLTASKYLRDLFLEIDDSEARVGIFRGLLALGDRRVAHILDECWRSMDLDERKTAACARWPHVMAAVVDFYLDCLEEENDDGVYGMLAAGLANMVGQRKHPRVSEIRRVFPVQSAGGGSPIEVLEEWSFPEYGQRIEPRFLAIALAEKPPRVLPRVMRAWGLSPGRLAGELITKCAQRIRTSGATGLLKEPVASCDFVTCADEREVLLQYGITNPMGPTLYRLSLLPVPGYRERLLAWEMLHHIDPEQVVLALLPEERVEDDLEPMLRRLFRENGASGQPMVPGSLPTYIVHAKNAPRGATVPWLSGELVRELFWSLLPALDLELLECEEEYYEVVKQGGMEKDLSDPTEVEEGFEKGPSNLIEAEGDPASLDMGASRNERPKLIHFDRTGFDAWFDRVTDRRHVKSTMRGVKSMWEDAIEWTGGGDGAALAPD
jgi:hypothetical protein